MFCAGRVRRTDRTGKEFLAVDGTTGLPSHDGVVEGLKAEAWRSHIWVRGGTVRPEVAARGCRGAAESEEGCSEVEDGFADTQTTSLDGDLRVKPCVVGYVSFLPPDLRTAKNIA